MVKADCFRLRLDQSRLLHQFVAYYLSSESARSEISLQIRGATRDRINLSGIAAVRVPIPSISEQTQLVELLDNKTAQIDALIGKKQRQIELLQEKRQALISQAVTKGFDPSVPMIDSGFVWLGTIPRHWKVRSFKYCGRIPNGQVDPEVDPYKSMILIAPNHIESETGRLLQTETAEEQAAESGKYIGRANDVIYSKIRPELQKACIAPYDCLCSADMYPITPQPDMESKYILYNLLCDWFTKYAVLWSDRVAMPKINRETLGTCMMMVPPIEEQRQIIRYIEHETQLIDSISERVHYQVGKLREYRQALITAAVTGKIDVNAVESATGSVP